ncbi:hypothetical protein C8F04DRAFT_1268599 [Mycena alexandri]|uniref:Bacteriophage T5 Orf172 DNA-binding domain-containing protein n=1 Tax=Mycena alexandri TaxID=1745969 RepID=A0AAD6SE48_9AGAR|nr:hypothetical protein C8F04DRAFT_1268599 [Mycena alexandri]
MTRCSRPRAAPRARLVVLHPVRTRSLANIRRLRNPGEQALALLAGPDPYKDDGEGFVYVHARVTTLTWNEFLAGRIPWSVVLAELEVKAGHTNDLERRVGEYNVCTPEYTFFWTCAYRTTRRMLLERLVHLALRQLGAKLRRYRCHGCGKRHREYYDFMGAGGFLGVERIIRSCLWKMGETAFVRIMAKIISRSGLFTLKIISRGQDHLARSRLFRAVKIISRGQDYLARSRLFRAVKIISRGQDYFARSRSSRAVKIISRGQDYLMRSKLLRAVMIKIISSTRDYFALKIISR